MPKYGTLFAKASGATARRCHVLGARWDDRWGFTQGARDSWVVEVLDGAMRLVHGVPGFITGLWVSPTGAAYASDDDARIHFNLNVWDPGSQWVTRRMRGVLTGVWGLNDDFVLVWGLLGRNTYVLHRWDGKQWSELASPGYVTCIRGTAPDSLIAVGLHGLISRWDGGQWHRVQSPSRATLSALCVVSLDEMYAVGAGGAVLEGSSHGWSERVSGQEGMFGVAKLDDTVFIGGARAGLVKLDGNQLTPVAPKVLAERLEPQKDRILLTSPGQLMDVLPDGKLEHVTSIVPFNDLIDTEPPRWLRARRP